MQYNLFIQILDVETSMVKFQNEAVRSKAVRSRLEQLAKTSKDEKVRGHVQAMLQRVDIFSSRNRCSSFEIKTASVLGL